MKKRAPCLRAESIHQRLGRVTAFKSTLYKGAAREAMLGMARIFNSGHKYSTINGGHKYLFTLR